jgi:hypothetical protein
MKTWVLIIILQLGDQPPIGITSVPGYTDLGECMSAGAALVARGQPVLINCIPGPPR